MHPGSGGNPGFNMYDLDSRMRLVFYPAIIGWFLIGVWIVSIRVKVRTLEDKIIELENGKTY
jgi:heme exporter protein C